MRWVSNRRVASVARPGVGREHVVDGEHVASRGYVVAG